MNAQVIELRVGSTVWLDGQIWSVTELGHTACLLSRDGELRSVATAHVLTSAQLVGDRAENATESDASIPSSNLVLSNLAPNARSKVEHRASVVRALLHDTDRPMQERLIDAAKTEGVSTRTLERWVLAYREGGVAGLAHSRTTGRYRSGVDPRWDEACLVVLADFTSRSTPTMNVVLDKIRQRLDEMHGPGEVPNPSKSTGYRRLTELSKGRHAFGSAKQRRSVARRPDGPYGRLRATRPGEYVVLDTTPLDVFAMEPVTLRWVPVELTVAQDLFTRCILGLRLTPISTTSADVANVLYQCVVPQRDASDDGHWPFHGVPRNLLVGTEEPDGVSQERLDGIPACLPEAIVVDHGKVYISSHVTSACARLGITIQPAIPYKPTDKPTVERFFRTLREGLL